MKRVPVWIVVVGIGLWLPAWTLFLSLSGCQSGTTGLLRPLSPTAEHTITNTVVQVERVASAALPAPWSTAAEAGGAAVLALLAAWQGLTHSKVKSLQVPTSPTKKDPEK